MRVSGGAHGVALLVLLCTLLVWGGVATPPQGLAQPVDERTPLRGSLTSYIAQFKDQIPLRDSQRFTPPEAGDTARLAAAMRRTLDAPDEAAVVLGEFGYRVEALTEESTERTLLIVREYDPCGRCWGLYVFSRAPERRDLMVQAPHPLFDALTPELATEVFLRSNAAHLFIAGSHRYASGLGSLVSDMSRNPDSLFQVMHQELSGQTTHVVQVHGFAPENHPGYPSIVLSNSTRQPHAELRELAGDFEAAGMPTGVWEGARWSQLSAGNNPQGRHTNSIGGRFYHLEFERAIRLDPDRRALAAQTIAEHFGASRASEPEFKVQRSRFKLARVPTPFEP